MAKKLFRLFCKFKVPPPSLFSIHRLSNTIQEQTIFNHTFLHTHFFINGKPILAFAFSLENGHCYANKILWHWPVAGDVCLQAFSGLLGQRSAGQAGRTSQDKGAGHAIQIFFLKYLFCFPRWESARSTAGWFPLESTLGGKTTWAIWWLLRVEKIDQ